MTEKERQRETEKQGQSEKQGKSEKQSEREGPWSAVRLRSLSHEEMEGT